MDYYNLTAQEIVIVKNISKRIDVFWNQIAARPTIAKKMIEEFRTKKTINGQKV